MSSDAPHAVYLEELRQTGDFARLIGGIPYARYLGLASNSSREIPSPGCQLNQS
jgi:hypothetical protein